MAEHTLHDPVLQFMRRLWSVAHELQRVSKRMEAVLHLTGPQRLALLMIGRVPGITCGELARFLHLHPATVTGILGRLERAGLVARTWDAADGRRMRLNLTPAGRAANRCRVGTVEAAVQRALAGVADGDAAAASRVLTWVADSLCQVAAASQRSPARASRRRVAPLECRAIHDR